MRGDRVGGHLGGLEDAALDQHRIHAGGGVLQAFAVDRLGQHDGGGRAVAGHVAGLAGDHVHELGAHVLEGLRQLDLLGDRHAVLGDPRASRSDFCSTTLRPRGPERRLDGPGQLRQAAADLRAGIHVEFHLFRCHGYSLRLLQLLESPSSADG